MIIDTMERLDAYAALGENFRTAVEYLKTTDLKAVPIGRHAIDGDRVYVLSQELHLTEKEMKWEAHARYADIQVILDGCERFGWGYEGKLDELDAEKDFRTCSDVKFLEYTLGPGMFTIYFPGEMHSPGNAVIGESDVRKVVVKVLYN